MPEVIECKTREAWLAARQTGVGGSEVAAVLGLSRYEDALTVYARKVGALPENAQSEEMEWGVILEPVVAQQYAARTGRRVEGGGYRIYRDVERPWRLATLDREQFSFHTHGDKPGVLEVKTSRSDASTWANAVPDEYFVQVQHQMSVAAMTWGTICCLHHGQHLRHYDVEPHDKLQQKIAARIEEFWQRVRDRRPPEAGPLSGEALRWLFPRESAGSIALGADADKLLDDYDAASQALTGAKETTETIKNKLRAMLGSFEIGITPSGRRVTWKLDNGTRSYVVAEKPPARKLYIGKGGE